MQLTDDIPRDSSFPARRSSLPVIFLDIRTNNHGHSRLVHVSGYLRAMSLTIGDTNSDGPEFL
jgi:hypothetical protein